MPKVDFAQERLTLTTSWVSESLLFQWDGFNHVRVRTLDELDTREDIADLHCPEPTQESALGVIQDWLVDQLADEHPDEEYLSEAWERELNTHYTRMVHAGVTSR